MKKNAIAKIRNVPQNVPNLKIIVLRERNNSDIKLHIPKRTVNGRKVPSVATGVMWYAYFYATNPRTGERRKFMYKKGINRFKTVSERKAFGKSLVQALKELLTEGFDPFGETTFFNDNKHYTLREALVEVYENKINDWKESTRNGMRFRLNTFLNWAADNDLDTYDIREIGKKHIIAFLNDMAVKSNNTSVNNYRSALSGLFGKLASDDIIAANFVKDIPKKKQKATKNKAFTSAQIAQIKEYLLENDPYLYTYIKFMTYAFLRNVEVVRLKVGDIDLKSRRIHVETKTQSRATIRIIELLRPTLEAMELHKYDKQYSLFSPSQKPAVWTTTESGKVSFFGDRFRKVKKHLGFGKEYGLYSFRHTFTLDLYNAFTKQGCTQKEAILKMLPITRHTNESGLRNYLRDVGGLLPKDYGENYTIDF